jgi:hypothetical protein
LSVASGFPTSQEIVMSERKPNFFVRLFLSIGVFLRFIFSGTFAAGVLAVRRAQKAKKGDTEPGAAPRMQEALPDSALQLLGLLQQEGRFVDFMEERVENFSDAEIGAAARVVHEGCRKALEAHFSIEPIHGEQEGARVTVPVGFDACSIRLTGNVVGEAPFTGTLVHRGWRAAEVKLPKVVEGHDVAVLASAEVEL